MIRQIILNRFDTATYTRYIKEISFKPSIDIIYNNALTALNEKDTEKAISYLVLIMDTDMNFEPLFHLSRLLLFSLSEEFMKKKGHVIKAKNKNLNLYIRDLEDQVLIFEREIIMLQNKISKSEQKLRKKFNIFEFFKKRKTINFIENSKNDILDNAIKIKKVKKDIYIASDLCKVEEYMKMTALILEVIVNKERFESMGYLV